MTQLNMFCPKVINAAEIMYIDGICNHFYRKGRKKEKIPMEYLFDYSGNSVIQS